MKKLIFSLLLGAAALGSSPLIAMDPPSRDQKPTVSSTRLAFESDRKVSFNPIRESLPIIRAKEKNESIHSNFTFTQEDIRNMRPLFNLGICLFQGKRISPDLPLSDYEDLYLQEKIGKIVILGDTNILNTLISDDPSVSQLIDFQSIKYSK